MRFDKQRFRPGVFFKKHTQLEAAVHRDLVNAGKWPVQLGKAYSHLLSYRTTGDYRFVETTEPEDARQAIELAEQIIRFIHEADPKTFPLKK